MRFVKKDPRFQSSYWFKFRQFKFLTGAEFRQINVRLNDYEAGLGVRNQDRSA